MHCPRCGADVEDRLKFCTECGAPMHPKPDFEKQTAFRHETFEQGPGPRPNPAEPLPVSEPHPGAPDPSPQSRPARQSQAPSQQSASPSGAKSRTGCLVGIIAAAVVVLLLAVSCSMLGRCTSALSGMGGSGPSATGNASGHEDALPSNAAVDSKETWTVLFYLCGSNLESEDGLATVNLQELTSTTLGDKVTFAIEAGGSRSWQNSTVDPRYLTRYSVSADGFYEEQRLPSASMAVASTFADFVSWGVSSFPADHYMLVLWDHGGGSVYGVCNDELYPYTSSFESDTLTLTEIAEGLDEAGATFDVIGFDTCLMGTYETAKVLQPYADYLVASEEVEPGSGWDYVSWPQWLGAHTGATGAQLGAEICDTYYSKCRLYNAADMATLSVVDLSKVDALSESFLSASREIATATSDRQALRSLYYASLKATCFGGDSSYNMVDMGDLMQQAGSVVSEHAGDVIDDIEAAVAYQVRGRSHARVSGMSVFYPLDTSYAQEFYDFLNVAGNVPYAQFAAVMFGQYGNVDWNAYAGSVAPTKAPVVKEDIAFGYDEGVNDAGQLQVNVTDGLDDLARVSIALALYMPDDGQIVYLGSDYNVNGDWDSGTFADNFYGSWMSIDGNWVSAELYEVGDDYNMYFIPVQLNGEASNLIARYDFDSQSYEVVCACASMDEAKLAAKELRALEPGDVVAFRFTGYDVAADEEIEFTMGEVTWSDDTNLEDLDLGAGAYLFRFVLTDVLGQDHPTDLYVQDYDGDTITVTTLEEYLNK